MYAILARKPSFWFVPKLATLSDGQKSNSNKRWSFTEKKPEHAEQKFTQMKDKRSHTFSKAFRKSTTYLIHVPGSRHQTVTARTSKYKINIKKNRARIFHQ